MIDFIPALLSILLGILVGTFTGLIPGLHINLISIFAITYFTSINPIYLAIFIFAMSITHTFLNAIPSVLLGAPESDMALAALPGHRLLLKGYGYDAIRYTIIGSFLGLLLTIGVMPFLLMALKHIYSFALPFIGFILIFISVFIIMKSKKRLKAIFIFIASGLLGFIALSTPKINQPLFPMLSGLFGCSLLTFSLFKKTRIPPQKKEYIPIKRIELAKALFGAFCSSTMITVFPAISPAIAAVISTQLIRKISQRAYLLMLGGINTIAMFSSVLFLYCLGKARNGAILALSKIVFLDSRFLAILTITALIVSGFAVLIAIFSTNIAIKAINKLNYSILNLSLLIFLFIASFCISGPLGVLLLVISTSIGLLANIWQIQRTTAMGCLLLPTIAWYFSFF